jgi:hypothetical protein
MAFTSRPLLAPMALLLAALMGPGAAPARAATFSENFNAGTLSGWTTFGSWTVESGAARSPAKSSNAVAGPIFSDLAYEGDVQVNDAFRFAGLLFRVTELKGEGADFKGYFLEVEFANDRTRLKLWRMDGGKWTALNSVMIYGVKTGEPIHLKVTASGPNIWGYAKDMSRPALAEFDGTYASGQVGIKNDGSPASFDNLSATDQLGTLPPAPLVKDWSWMQGAVFYPSYAANSVTFWTQYDGAVVDREISYAKLYGLNTLSIYFNWLAWKQDRAGFLRDLEDFLGRADGYGLKVFPIFFDNVGNVEPTLDLLKPKVGVHNSLAMESPSWPILSGDYPSNRGHIRDTLKAFVQSVVKAHLNDSRILFWQVYNEPIRDNADIVNGPAVTDSLVRDGYFWIKETGTALPAVSTAGDFLGGRYSDFYTFHTYVYDPADVAPKCARLQGGDGGSEHLCTETLSRPWLDMQCMTDYFRARKTGFVFWEFLIARTQISFPWSCNAGSPCVDGSGVPIQPAAPFHGMIYPDGHPWSLEDVKTMLKTDDLSTLPVFDVTYWQGNFAAQKKTGKGQGEPSSIAPRIDFDLPDEFGQGSPDPIARVSANQRDDWSIRWTGKVLPPCAGEFTFRANSDNIARLWIGTTQVLDKRGNARGTVSGTLTLAADRAYDLKVEYVHATGPASMHVTWQGPCFAEQPLPGRRAGTPASLQPAGAHAAPQAPDRFMAKHKGGTELALPPGLRTFNGTVSIFDGSGRKLREAEARKGRARMESPLPEGLYPIGIR